jgi:formylmethanofuran dehydrogenase subunit E
VSLVDHEAELEELLRLVDRSFDLVLVEGMRRSPLPKILINRPELGPPPELLGEVWAVVEEERSDLFPDAPRFPPAAVAALAKHIEQRLLGGPARSPAWNLPALLAEAGRHHGHLCPGQVLGLRMAILGCERLGIVQPKSSKRLIVFVETDRCGADAIQTVTGCTLGKRTLKFVDYGKLAATFLDTETGRAVRVAARESSREAAQRFAPEEPDRRQAQLRAYKALADTELFTVEDVNVVLEEDALPGAPTQRTLCESCGEGVNDGREVPSDGRTLCRACAGGAYYTRPVIAQPEEPQR